MSEIDWSRPIEAVHEDGTVASVTFEEDDGAPDLPIRVSPGPHGAYWYRRDGSKPNSKWRIRNVAQPTPERDPALWDRMEALVKRMVSSTDGTHTFLKTEHYDEARAILAALPKPVDPDLVEARRIVGDAFDGGTKSLNGDAVRAGARDNAHEVQLALAAIKRGRALAAQDAARG